MTIFLATVPAYAQGTGSDPWDNAVNVLKTAFTGTIATGLSLVAIVVGGLMFAYGEGQSKRMLAGIVFGVGMAVGAVNFMAWLFPASHSGRPQPQRKTRSIGREEMCMAEGGPRQNKVYKAMNRPLTILGAERQTVLRRADYLAARSSRSALARWAASDSSSWASSLPALPPSMTWRFCACS